MGKIKLAVYDTSKGFSSFLKHYYSKELQIEVCSQKKQFNLDWFNDFEYCFFVVNDTDDLFNFMKVAQKPINLVTGSTQTILEEKIKSLKINGLNTIDLRLNKTELIGHLTAYLKNNGLLE